MPICQVQLVMTMSKSQKYDKDGLLVGGYADFVCSKRCRHLNKTAEPHFALKTSIVCKYETLNHPHTDRCPENADEL
jgi:hypothetical protein